MPIYLWASLDNCCPPHATTNREICNGVVPHSKAISWSELRAPYLDDAAGPEAACDLQESVGGKPVGCAKRRTTTCRRSEASAALLSALNVAEPASAAACQRPERRPQLCRPQSWLRCDLFKPLADDASGFGGRCHCLH